MKPKKEAIVQTMSTRKRTLSLLLVLAMLTLAFAAILPVAAAEPEPEPEPEEIQDFGYQSSAAFAIGGESTDLRFLFTIGSTDYDEVGFVFSFENHGNNKTPTVGGSGCYTVNVDTVYRSVRAGGETVNAPDGRWWVAAKLTNIPFASYYEWIYVRAFVTDGGETTYSDAVKLNALKANRGSGESIHEAVGTSSTGNNTVIEYKRNIYTDVLDSGAKHFYPDASNNYEGSDLLIEYSVWFSSYLVDYLDGTNGPAVEARIANEDYHKSSQLVWWSPCNNCLDSYCSVAGGFEAPSGLTTTVSDEEVTTPAGMVSDGGTYADYPNIGGSDPENPEYGWHRIGIRIHEEVTTLPTANTSAQYLFTVTTYVDGRAVSKLQGTLSRSENYLYTATYNKSKGKVEYNDIATSKYVYIYHMKYKGINPQNNEKKHFAYCVFADAYATCGKDFVQTVEHVHPIDPGPDRGGYRAENEKLVNCPRYYRIVIPGSLSVMSYNIGVYDSPKGGAGWEGRDPAKVAETVLTESPDIVGFQEVNQKGNDGWEETLASLATAGGYTRLEGGYTGRYDFEKNEIFYKTSKFTKLAEGTKTFRATASELGIPNPEDADPDISNIDRIFHYAVLQETSTGKQILVVNTHLHYGGMGEEDHKLRRYEIRALLAWLETQEATYPDQIVMGDMNAHYKIEDSTQGHNTMNLFTDGGFDRTNSAAVASVRGDIGGTLAESGRTTRPKWIYDYILVKGNIDTAYYTVVDNPIDAGGTYPSDHVPVLARIYLR